MLVVAFDCVGDRSPVVVDVSDNEEEQHVNRLVVPERCADMVDRYLEDDDGFSVIDETITRLPVRVRCSSWMTFCLGLLALSIVGILPLLVRPCGLGAFVASAVSSATQYGSFALYLVSRDVSLLVAYADSGGSAGFFYALVYFDCFLITFL